MLTKVTMSAISGDVLRQWREHAGWDVPETALRLIRLAHDGDIAIARRESVERMIYRWESPANSRAPRGARYLLLYVKALGLKSLDELASGPAPDAGRSSADV